MKTREPTYFEENGEKYLRVPLGPHQKISAVISLIDYEFMKHLGLSLNWNQGHAGFVRSTASKAPNGYVSVARVLLDCGEHERVKYRNGDVTDLRRSNLSKIWTMRAGLKRDRDFLSTPPAKRLERLDGRR